MAVAWYLDRYGWDVELIDRERVLGGRVGADRLGDEPVELGGKNIGRNYRLFREFTGALGNHPFTYFGFNTSAVENGRIITADSRLRILGFWRTMAGARPRDLLLFGRLLLASQATEAGGYIGNDYYRQISNSHDDRPINAYFSEAFCRRVIRPISVRMNGAEPDEIHLGTFGTNLRLILDEYDQLRDGFEPIFEQLSHHVHVRLETRVESLVVRHRRVVGLRFADPFGADGREYDAVVLALPAHVSAQLLGEVLPQTGRLLQSMRYFPVATVVAEYADEIFRPKLRALRFDGGSILSNAGAYRPDRLNVVRYTFSGRAARSLLLEHGNAESLVDLGERELSRYLPIRPGSRRTSAARYWPCGLCAYGPFQHAAVDRIMADVATVKGLFLTGDYMKGVSIEGCFRAARHVADLVQRSALTGKDTVDSARDERDLRA
jgi:oxygen-dependent protoporphyrinogen oxidase